jgi:hypothetical protein
VKLTVQVVAHADDETETVVREAFTVQREEPLALDTLGLQLAEAKDLLAAVQDSLVSHQVSTALSAQGRVPELRDGAAAQGQPAPGDADSAGQAASGQSTLVALRLPTSEEQNVQPLGRDTPGADHPGVVLPAGALRGAGLLRSRRDGWFDVIAGKEMPATGKSSCFGYVQTYDKKPQRRLFDVRTSHGMTGVE